MALMQMEFKSETLKRTVSMNVILPIERFRGPFPTLYLLHGLTDNYNGWLKLHQNPFVGGGKRAGGGHALR